MWAHHSTKVSGFLLQDLKSQPQICLDLTSLWCYWTLIVTGASQKMLVLFIIFAPIKMTLVYHTILYSSLCSVVLKCVSTLEHLYGHRMDIILGRELRPSYLVPCSDVSLGDQTVRHRS